MVSSHKYSFYFLSGFLLFWLLHSTASVGQGTNPFEISSRVMKEKKIEKVASETTDTIADLRVSESPTTSRQADMQLRSRENPFEVSHNPIPSAIGKETKPLNESTSSLGGGAILLWMLLLSCALLAIAINANPKYFLGVHKSVWNYNRMMLFHREFSSKPNISAVLLYLVFFLQAALLVLQITDLVKSPEVSKYLPLFFAGIACLYIIRHAALFIFGRIFQVSRSTSRFSFTILLSNFMTGIFLVPFNFLLAFGPQDMKQIVLILALAVVGVMMLLRYLRGLFFISDYLPGRFFQIMLYLCTFEIAPVLILIKYISHWSRPF